MSNQPHPNGGDARPLEGIDKESNPTPTRQRGEQSQHTSLDTNLGKMPRRQSGKPGMQPKLR